MLLTTALPSLGWWPLVFVLAPLWVVVARAGRGRAALAAGFAFGLPFFAVYVLWLPRSFGQLFGPAFWFVFPALVALLALFWGLTCWAAWRLAGGRRGRPPGARVLLLLPVLWVLVEWARTQGYFAFPWGTLGYAWLATPVAQLAEFVGVYGLSLLATVGAALLAWPFAALGPASWRARLGNLSLAVAALLALLGFGFWQGARLTPAGVEAAQQRALLVQGNVDPFARAATAAQELDIHLELTAAAAAEGPFDLVVWPEGAVIGYQLAPSDAAPLRQVITSSAPGAGFIVGGRTYEGVMGDSYNSLFSLWDGALLGRYDKEYLVPFGERWPLIGPLEGLYRTVFGFFGLPLLASSLPGSGPHTLLTKIGPVAAFICYESVFPQVQRAMVSQGAQVLVLATNDAWFGLGNGAQQHFDMGRLRAIETRRWLLRSGNDGITAAVDPYGRVTQQLPRHVAAALPVTFQLLDGSTFWVRYGQLTPVVLAAWTVLFWLLVLLSGRRQDHGSKPEAPLVTLTDA